MHISQKKSCVLFVIITHKVFFLLGELIFTLFNPLLFAQWVAKILVTFV